MTWDAVSTVTREEAKAKILAEAASKGYSTFKVYYDGNIIESPSSLPEAVDMSKVEIGQKADQA